MALMSNFGADDLVAGTESLVQMVGRGVCSRSRSDEARARSSSSILRRSLRWLAATFPNRAFPQCVLMACFGMCDDDVPAAHCFCFF